MWGFTPWQMVRGMAFDKFVRAPLMALARLGHFLAVWWL